MGALIPATTIAVPGSTHHNVLDDAWLGGRARRRCSTACSAKETPCDASGASGYTRRMWMFFSCVKRSSSSRHSSRPKPDCLTPPNGAPRKCWPTSLIQT